MKILIYAGTILLTMGTAFYTFNFGTWVWKKGYKRGGIGVWLLAAITAVFPMYMLFFWSR